MTTKTGVSTLDPEQVHALTSIENGADVYSYGLACTLRALRRTHPEYLKIVRAKGAPRNVAAHQPYFGACLTAAGKRLIAGHKS